MHLTSFNQILFFILNDTTNDKHKRTLGNAK